MLCYLVHSVFLDMCESSLKETIGLDVCPLKNLYVNNLEDGIYFSHALLFCAFCFCRYVGKFIKKNDRIGSSDDKKFTNLYVNNLEDDVTEELLAEKFSKFGKIFNVAIMRDENGHPRGFGFVNFEDPDDAKTAMEQMNGLQIGKSIGSLYLGHYICIRLVVEPKFGYIYFVLHQHLHVHY